MCLARCFSTRQTFVYTPVLAPPQQPSPPYQKHQKTILIKKFNFVFIFVAFDIQIFRSAHKSIFLALCMASSFKATFLCSDGDRCLHCGLIALLLSMYSLLLSMYSYCCLCILYCCLCILIVVYVFFIVVYVFLLLSMYSYCCLCILIVRPCILIVVYVYLLLSMYC
jgi:hypothetical protein